MGKNKQRKHLWLTLATIFVALGWAAIPLLQSGASSAATESADDYTATTILHATLSGTPINNSTPHGDAGYWINSDNSRVFNVSVTSVNVAANTQLTVFVNSTQVGQLTVSSAHSGFLNLDTHQNQTVPMVAAGDTITVKQGTTTILSGTFAAQPTPSPSPTGSHTPTPSPSHTPTPTHTPTPVPTPRATPLFAQLTGAPIGNIVPRGFAQAESSSDGHSLEFFVNNVNLPSNTTLTVFVGDTNVGTFNLNNRCGEFESHSSTLPTIAAGTTITIKNGATTILSGTFANGFPSPSPSPSGSPTPHPTVSPSPSPSGSPTPHPTPRPARFFEARLRGGNVVPPVTTDARGFATIRLNDAETEITVSAGFFGLSGEQTTATINGPAQPDANGAVIFDLGTVGGTMGFIPNHTFTVTAEQVAQLRAGVLYIVIGDAAHTTGEIRGQFRAHGHHGDFEGDGFADVSVFRPTDGKFYFLNSSDNQFRAQTLGGANDRVVSGDYDGDGIIDAAVFRIENGAGVFTILRSDDNAVVTERWGASGDVPVVGDFDGDDVADLAVFRPSNGTWYIRRSSDNSVFGLSFGQAGDVPVAGDFDGDGSADIAVFRPSNGAWYEFRSGDNSFYAAQWGTAGDVPIVGDFDGDGRSDITVFRPSDGIWYTLRSLDNRLDARQFGQAGDIPIVGEFDADGLTDIAVFRPSNGFWYQLRSTSGFTAIQFGMNGDVPAADTNY